MSSTQQTELGWFRTPIAAAMLSGLLAEGTAICLSRKFTGIPTKSEMQSLMILNIVATIVACALKLSGPAICHRSGRLFSYALIYVIPILIIPLVLRIFLFRLVYEFFGLQSTIAIQACSLIPDIVTLCMITYVLARLYELRPCPPRVFAAASLTAAVLFAVWEGEHLLWRMSSGSVEFQEQIKAGSVMLRMLCGIATTTFPTIAIEKALKQKAALQAATAPAAPATSPAASDASSATH